MSASDVETVADDANSKDVLRFLVCGSVDDGKSTLLGRLLADCGSVTDDELQALAADSRVALGTDSEVDYSLLLDGLVAEREQKITIDVAHRYFSTSKRKFIVADSPGHEQYTRNMATAASRADLAILLVDVRKGLLAQTFRHLIISRLLGIRHVIVAINKMDLVNYEFEPYAKICRDCEAFAKTLDGVELTLIPVAARLGDNVTAKSDRMAWYDGPALLEILESVGIRSNSEDLGFRLPVQWVCRPHQDFRGYAGTVRAGSVRTGDEVLVLPGRHKTRIESVRTAAGLGAYAGAGESVLVTVSDNIDISRGCFLTSLENEPVVADQFAAHIINFSDKPLFIGRKFTLMCGPQKLTATLTEIKHTLNVTNLDKLAASNVGFNQIAYCNLETSQHLIFDPYERNRELGGFILVDRDSNETIAGGTMTYALTRSQNLRWQGFDVTREVRANQKNQRAICVWLTGLSGSGKSTLANLLERRLVSLDKHAYTLDGDNVRHGLNRDLGFTEADRVENIRRVSEVARLMVDAGLITIVSFISPYRADRDMARQLFSDGEFLEVFVDTPIDLCERRDPKGLYAKARAGKIPNFTGISAPYEVPQSAEVVVRAGAETPDQCVEKILSALLEKAEAIAPR